MNENVTFKVITLGCKLNCCESAAIEKTFSQSGFEKTEGAADVYIINSCAVTSASVAKARHAASRCRRENPKSVIALCGCYPQSYPEEAGLRFDADVVVGNSDKTKLCAYVAEYLKNRVKTVKVNPIPREFDEKAAVPDEDRTRAFIKIEDGCDRFCAYCIIPTARGRVRSLSRDKLAEQAAMCFENGHKEIVLTGINLCCYGQDIGLTLADAAEAAAECGVPRIRLSSLEPEMMDDELIERLSSVRALCPHFHLSLQSGSDNVLRLMNRKYDTEKYRNVAEKLREAFPGCSITTDIIVGFPGETDEDFEKTAEFAEEMKFAKVHVFPYSIRKGTIAAEMPQLPPSVKTQRARVLADAVKKLEKDFLAAQKGKLAEVLIEKPQSAQYSHGFTENYTPVRIYGEEIPRHTLVKVLITGVRDGACVGRVVNLGG